MKIQVRHSLFSSRGTTRTHIQAVDKLWLDAVADATNFEIFISRHRIQELNKECGLCRGYVEEDCAGTSGVNSDDLSTAPDFEAYE
jgi:hypothetical protein